MKVQVEVKQGAIKVNSITLLNLSKEVIAISIDTQQKYVMVDGMGSEEYAVVDSEGVRGKRDHTRSIYLWYGENTIGVKHLNGAPTEVKIILPEYWLSGKGSSTLYSCGRYSTQFAVVRQTGSLTKPAIKNSVWTFSEPK